MAFLQELQEKFGKAFGENIIGYKITVMEGFGAVIEGYKGVSSANPEEIRFRAGKTFITVAGSKLEIKDINGNEAFVAGDITDITFGTAKDGQKGVNGVQS